MEPGELVRVGRWRPAMKLYKQLDEGTVINNEPPRLEDILHANSGNVDSEEKVQFWIKAHPQWREQPVWKPSEHPSSEYHDTFIHICDLGNDAEHPIEIEDDGYFTSFELVTDIGIIRDKETWEELSDDRKRYWREEWWYEKPWDELKDPGAISEESDEDEV